MGLAGCASPVGIAPTIEPIEPAALGLAAAGADIVPVPVEADWWRAFDDPTLTRLVEAALVTNPGLDVALARVAQADAMVVIAGAATGPQVNGAFDLTRRRYSANGAVATPLAGSQRTAASVQAGASWDLDFFGRNDAAIAVARGNRRAADAQAAAVRTALAVKVAQTYVQLAQAIEQREIARRTLAQREELLALIRQRVRQGLDSQVELRQGEGALPETRQRIEALNERITLAHHALAALTARAPDAWYAVEPALARIAPVALPAQLPADLLARRADVTAARWQVEAALGEVQGARAGFYPNLNLVAFAGLASLGLDRLLRASSSEWGVGPAVRLPIFDGGRLRGEFAGRTAALDGAIGQYNGVVVAAVHQAADQLASLASLELQRAQQAQALRAAEAAYDLARQRYRAGLSSYLVVLNVESTLLAQRNLQVDLKARVMATQVALIEALGGGYRVDPAEAPQPIRAAVAAARAAAGATGATGAPR